MVIPQTLTPIINRANSIVAKADAAAFLADLLSLTPLPAGKTVEQVVRYNLTVNPDGSLAVSVDFKA